MKEKGAEPPSRLACAQCRRKHVKCDGVTPVCQRCADESVECSYTPSRRGLARRRRDDDRRTLVSAAQWKAHLCAKASSENPNTNANTNTNTNALCRPIASRLPVTRSSDAPATAIPAGSAAVFNDNNNTLTPLSSSSTSTLTEPDSERLINLFYLRFYPAHPILVPRAFFNAQQYPDYLELVVCFIGQHYIFTGNVCNDAVCGVTTSIHHAVDVSMSPDNDEDTVHRVQALILYSILLHGRHQTREAETCIARAARIALSLGMNQPEFASNMSNFNTKLEQSIRRTWWELFIVDAYMAALHRRATFTTSHLDVQPLLPCTQSEFELADFATPAVSLQMFDARVFSGDSAVFSPYCYRIEAIRIVERVLALAASDNVPADEIQSVDNAIASWKYHLPNHGTDVVDPSGDIDPLLFQANFMIHCATIFLHFPRSDLPPTVPSANNITCAKGYTQLTPTSSHHTVKAIAASKEISNLAAIPCQLDQHSPFFSCGLILGCIVQLAAASIHLHSCGTRCLQQHRDRVVLLLGLLKCLGKTWALAQNAVHHLRIVANTVFAASHEPCENATCTSESAHDSAMDLGDLPSSVSWFDLFSPMEFQESLLSFPLARS